MGGKKHLSLPKSHRPIHIVGQASRPTSSSSRSQASGLEPATRKARRPRYIPEAQKRPGFGISPAYCCFSSSLPGKLPGRAKRPKHGGKQIISTCKLGVGSQILTNGGSGVSGSRLLDELRELLGQFFFEVPPREPAQGLTDIGCASHSQSPSSLSDLSFLDPKMPFLPAT